ncbi:MAG: extracellular solute-binding protein [Oligosphaeraceae bacterium]
MKSAALPILAALLLLCHAFPLPLPGQEFPLPGWEERPDPAADPENALPGGTFTSYLGPSPKSLNYYLDNNVMSAQVTGLLYESLLARDPDTLEFTPWLASRWTISPDRQTFTFWLDEKARWSDGTPVTPEDVLWTVQTLKDPKNLTGPIRYQLERMEEPVLREDGGIQFRAKSLHWQNLSTLGGLAILPRHAFQGQDFNQVNFQFPVVNGPYRIRQFQEGQHLLLEKREDYWRRDYPACQGIHNFQFLKLRFFEDPQNAFDAFKKGEIDAMAIYTASLWHGLENQVTAVRNHWIVKQEIHNQEPVGMQGFAMNLRRPLFQDLRVRKALAMLLNREFMNQTMMYGQYFLHRSYMEDLYDAQHPCPASPTPYDPAQAAQLLDQAGWALNPQTGWREKDGRPFSFVFLNRGGTSNKFLAVYGEALKAAGIQMTIETKDWSAWAKAMDDYDFDMTWAAWGGSLFKDPEQLWSSREGSMPGSSNITGFANPQVDSLIQRQKGLFSVQERNEICRQIDAILVQDFPYLLLWNLDYTRLLYWNKFGTPPKVLGRFGGTPESLWWLDPDRQEELQDAMDSDTPLPPEPASVSY